MKLIGISDIHGNLPKLPECDVVCIAGDILPLAYQNSTLQSVSWFLQDFIPWTDSLRCDEVIFIAGNHDFMFGDLLEKYHKEWWEVEELLLIHHKFEKKIHYLCDSLYTYKGIKFYGTPWIPDLQKWAFYANPDKLTQKFSQIPPDIDVLITHAPPKVADCGTVLQHCWNWNKNFGCKELTEQYPRIKPKYHLFGHVHTGEHRIVNYYNSNLVNVSIKDENYQVVFPPFEFEINDKNQVL